MWQFMQIYVQQLRMQMGAPTIESAMHMSLAANYIQEHKKDIDHPSFVFIRFDFHNIQSPGLIGMAARGNLAYIILVQTLILNT